MFGTNSPINIAYKETPRLLDTILGNILENNMPKAEPTFHEKYENKARPAKKDGVNLLIFLSIILIANTSSVIPKDNSKRMGRLVFSIFSIIHVLIII